MTLSNVTAWEGSECENLSIVFPFFNARPELRVEALCALGGVLGEKERIASGGRSAGTPEPVLCAWYETKLLCGLCLSHLRWHILKPERKDDFQRQRSRLTEHAAHHFKYVSRRLLTDLMLHFHRISESANWFQTDSVDRQHVCADGRHLDSPHDSFRKLLWQRMSESGDIWLIFPLTQQIICVGHSWMYRMYMVFPTPKSLINVTSWSFSHSEEKKDYNNLYFSWLPFPLNPPSSPPWIFH